MTDPNVELSEVLNQTSSSLLVRIREKDQDAWRRLVHLYTPLVYRWCSRFGLQEADAADVGQEVFRTVSNAIGNFHHDLSGDSFRGWLRTVTQTRCLDLLRKKQQAVGAIGGSDGQAMLLDAQAPASEPESSDREEKVLLIRAAVDSVLEGCREQTRQAFLRVVLAEEHPADVARDLGMTVNAVYLARSHILRRVREEYADLVDP